MSKEGEQREKMKSREWKNIKKSAKRREENWIETKRGVQRRNSKEETSGTREKRGKRIRR